MCIRDRQYTFVNNPDFQDTNYIYSIYLAKSYLADDDILLMHGDLVFENSVLQGVLAYPDSCMTVSSTAELPEKDFKAVVENGFIRKVGVNYFEHALSAQALYKLKAADWSIWIERI